MNKVFSTLLIFFSIVILILSVRGLPGIPNKETINDARWIEDGPFELSPERGRFALTYSLVEDKSVYFSTPIARFTLPDLGYKDGRYVSLFAPGVSFIAVPGYLLGRVFGISQVGAFLTIAFFAVLNVILIRKISKLLGAGELPAAIASLIFLFATPAFNYAVTLYQHHISTFLILLSLYSLLRFSVWRAHLIVWFLYSLAISVDYPNALLMSPIIIYMTGSLLRVRDSEGKTSISLKIGKLTALAGIVFPLLFFLWFNRTSYGNPLQLAGTVDDVAQITFSGAIFIKFK